MNDYDWNRPAHASARQARPITLQDETLRDGIQSASATDPTIAQKIELIHLMDRLGIDVVNVGLPAASLKNREDVRTLCREIQSAKLRIRPSCAARTVVNDVRAIVEVSQELGMEIAVYTFIGSSPIRQYAEGWGVDRLLQNSASAISEGEKAGLPVAYVTEDTTRSRPELLATLFKSAIDHGASRLCIADTVGHATPDGTRHLIGYVRGLLEMWGAHHVGIDWHGHNDRGLVLVNALTAMEAGADRVHGCALGIGERVGNAPMELLMTNLEALGLRPAVHRHALAEYCRASAVALGWQIPKNHAVLHDQP